MNLKGLFTGIVFVTLTVLQSGCSYYARKNPLVQEYVARGEITKAHQLLQNDKKWDRGNNRLLYYLNRGTVAWMLNKTDESIEYFNKADLYIEDYRKHPASQSLALVSNPKVVPYPGEDFEKVMFHYYQAMNYINKQDFEAALVQCKRMQIQLNQLDDKYGKSGFNNSNRYRQDAFIHNLMGLIYDALGDFNNAFIAFRNSFDIYEEDYSRFFGIRAPDQLKKDLLRAAYKTGFDGEVKYYEEKFGMKYDPEPENTGSLLFFWNNGLGPVKTEWSINFTIIRGEVGWITFVNHQYGYSIPVYVGGDNKDNTNFSKIEFVRAAFPKYLERKPVWKKASIIAGGQTHQLEIAQNINDIAFKTLEDRFLREMGTSLLRLALKKSAEYQLRDQNKDAGAALGIFNAITEQADTRNWQTLPHTIYYTRINLPEGNQEVKFKTSSSQKNNEFSNTLNFFIRKGKTTFHSYNSLDTYSLFN